MNISQDIDSTYSFQLENGLRVLIIHKQELTSCCVSASIRAGHFFDPEECPGLAHLLEHMLFMGNAVLPQPNAINELMEQAGGNINAWTGTEFANYHFQVHAQALPRVLPAFAAMLGAPNFDTEQIQSEIKSIDAEFKFKRKDDLRRLYQIHKETANPAHPFTKFSVGNQQTFGKFSLEQLQEKLQAFHDTYYCAANMTLVIHSPFSVGQITPWLTQAFAPLPTGQAAEINLPVLYTPEQLGVEIHITPLQAAKRMIVTFALPPLHLEIATRPLDFISHVLGDEGAGSLFAYLKARGWVTNLIAGSGIEGVGFKDFNINLQLTDSGLDNQFNIVSAIFHMVELIKMAAGDEWRLLEKAKLNQLARQYDDSHKPLQTLCDLAELHQYFDWDTIASASQNEALTSESLNRALAYFVPENLRIKLIAPGLATNRRCAHYDAAYAIKPISSDSLARWKKPAAVHAISMPPKNPYIGDSYSLCPLDNRFAMPQEIREEKGMSIWFCQDHTFRVPKGDVFISFDIPSLAQNIHQVAAKRLWLAGLNDYLQGQFYRAEIAGLHYRIYGHQGGFTLHTRGFSAQQGQLVQKLTNAIHAFEPDPQTFLQVKSLQCQSLQNTLLNKPINRLFSRLSVLIQRNTHAPVELLDAVEQCQFDDVRRVKDRAFDYYHLEGLIHGNWSKEAAERIADSVIAMSPGAKASPLPRAIAKLPVGRTMVHEVSCDHEDAAVVLYLQAPSNDTWNVAMCMVLEQMLAGSFFSTLRTEKQLGYLVGSGYVPHNQHPGITFYIQSPTHGPQVLMSHISQFLQQQTRERAFYEGYWPNIQRNLLKQLQDVDLNQSMRSQRIWQGLGSNDSNLHRNQLIASTIESMSFDDIIGYATNMNLNQTFGELVLFSAGKFPPLQSEEQDTITHIADFKSRVEFYL
ncbi:peptidase M16 [Aestuariibacter sp. GS-14]|uniref:insulinase family protein n=1 Tax=Aestuariibacter sp. GS-14 TaxID=2590670 RepID=UPI00112E4E95|nr:insulinase family protein [Aestuariibacter sp. GS-14]TPV61749.1 peptidase M16 [Aestuariibacter sp. GS-14]